MDFQQKMLGRTRKKTIFHLPDSQSFAGNKGEEKYLLGNGCWWRSGKKGSQFWEWQQKERFFKGIFFSRESRVWVRLLRIGSWCAYWAQNAWQPPSPPVFPYLGGGSFRFHALTVFRAMTNRRGTESTKFLQHKNTNFRIKNNLAPQNRNKTLVFIFVFFVCNSASLSRPIFRPTYLRFRLGGFVAARYAGISAGIDEEESSGRLVSHIRKTFLPFPTSKTAFSLFSLLFRNWKSFLRFRGWA